MAKTRRKKQLVRFEGPKFVKPKITGPKIRMPRIVIGG